MKESKEKETQKYRKRRKKTDKGKMAERIWAKDRLFNGLDRYELDGGDRRVFEEGQRFDPLIGGARLEDRRIVVEESVDLDAPVDERDTSYEGPDESCSSSLYESCESELQGLAPSQKGVNPWRVIRPLCSSPVSMPPEPNVGFEEGDEICQEDCGGDGHVGLCNNGPASLPFGRYPGEVG